MNHNSMQFRKQRTQIGLYILLGGVLLGLVAFSGGVSAQTPPPVPPMAAAAVLDTTAVGTNVLLPDPAFASQPFLMVSNLRWSADGRTLAYTETTDMVRRVVAHDAETNASVLLAEEALLSPFPPTFSLDSQQVIYAVDGSSDEIITSAESLPSVPTRVFSVDVTGGEPTFIGEILTEVGCGGGSPVLMDGLYNQENGPGLGGNALTFQMTPFGLLYTTSCSGIGLALLDIASGEVRVLNEDVGRAKVSPDGTQAAVITFAEDRVMGQQVGILDLASGSLTTFESTSLPDQVAWGLNGEVYYTTRQNQDTALPISAEVDAAFQQVMGFSALTLPNYAVELFRLDVTTGEAALVWSTSAYGIGGLTATADGLYFTVIPNGEGWVNALADGTVVLSGETTYLAEWATAAPTLYLLSDGSVQPILSGVFQAALRPGA